MICLAFNQIKERFGIVIDLEDQDDMFNDVFRLMQIRKNY